MKYIKLLIVIVVVSFLGCEGKAQKKSNGSPEIYSESFFEKFKENNINEGVDNLFLTNKENNDSNLTNQIISLKHSLNEMKSLFGNYHGYELITKKSLGTVFVSYSYLVKFSKQPIRFIFMFYFIDNKWSIYKFKYDADLEDELEEAGKLYFLDR